MGTLGGKSSEALAINERGQIAGRSFTAKNQQHAFLWEKGKLTDIGTLGGKSSEAVAINNRGQIAGDGFTATNEHPRADVQRPQPQQTRRQCQPSLSTSHRLTAAKDEPTVGTAP